MDYHKVLSLVIPTNEPDTYRSHIKNSWINLSVASKYITILFNFQSPWNEDSAKDEVNYCKSLGFDVKYSFNEYEKPKEKGHVHFNRIRYDAAKLLPDSLIFALVDDDMVFQDKSPAINQSSGLQYLSAIHYMLSNEKCGIILFSGTMVRKVKKYHISPVDIVNTYITNKGLFLKNVDKDNGLVLDNNAVDLVGSDEEKLASGFRLVRGYYPAKIAFVRVLHYESYNKKNMTPGYIEYGWSESRILDENANKFIKDNYNSKFKGKGHYDIVLYDDYLKNGGVDYCNNEIFSSLDYDYTNETSDSLISKIDILLENRGI